ncbi:MAG: glycosyl hydrolase, partial [Acidobacteria bacterium]|nr:glycosyl hydrolase [Acidobacteriota bacterium]
MQLRPLAPLLALIAFPLVAAPPATPATPAPAPAFQERFPGLAFRNIGPFRGGRVTAVTGVPGNPWLYYFGGTGSGVFRTTDAGGTWEPMSEKDFKTGSVGALAVAESDPNVLYAGMGEAPIRGNVSHGDGVWKSTDAGKSWKNVGLADTRQIARVRIHPKNPDVVWVAAQGHVFGPNAERGIFKTTDGGTSWRKVLFVDEKTGASDLALDPSNPRILFAGFWQVRRTPWSLESGGPGSSLHRSTDGGGTWTKLTKGLPEGVLGKICVAVSPANPQRVWAMVESQKGGLFRSDDGGETFTKASEDRNIRQRAWYYTRVYADPKTVDTVYVLNVNVQKSVDGGKSWKVVPTGHGDNHDLWIDPQDPLRMIEGDDGGAQVTLNGGRTWSTLNNQPTSQFYRVITDDRFPYNVYGAQQDNTTVKIASASSGRTIRESDWHDVGGCESGWIAPHPGKRNIVFAGCYGGSITRYDHETKQEREIVAWPQLAVGQAPKDLRYRFQWNAPIVFSRDGRTLYHAAQLLLASTDEGQTWREASPDLTRNDRTKQEKSGGPITKDDTGVEVYGTIFALTESPHDTKTLWAGTDDGLVHLTEDAGATWKNVTPKDLPAWIQINAIDVSPHDPAAAYVAATMYKHDDFRPYLYKTTDRGASWTKIVKGLPETSFTRVVREDPVRRGLLYAGTETGLFVSLDDGASWQPFQRNLPAVPLTDLTIKHDDLVLATQGRSFWILDDLSPLRAFTPELAASAVAVIAPRPATRRPGGTTKEPSRTAGQNPKNGLYLNFWLRDVPKEPLTLEVLDGETVLRTFKTKRKDEPEKEKKDEAEGKDDEEEPIVIEAGFNRFVWDLELMKPALLPKAVIWGSKRGPRVAPGTYTLRLKTAEGAAFTQKAEVRANPELGVSPAELAAQHQLLRTCTERLATIHQTTRQLRDVKDQVKKLVERATKLGKGKDLEAPAKELDEKLT